MVTSAPLCTAVTASAASTCAVSRLSSTQKASETAMRRPGGQAPSIQPISITMLGSSTVTQRRQCNAECGDDAGHVPGEDVGRAGAEPEFLAQPPGVREVVQRHHRLHAPRRGQARGSRRSARARRRRTLRDGARAAPTPPRAGRRCTRWRRPGPAPAGCRQKSHASPERATRPVASQPDQLSCGSPSPLNPPSIW